MKLIHTGDLHLDARMETGLTPVRARIRRQELLSAFARLAEEAERQSAALLIAGDLFDTDRVTELTRRYVGEVIAAHPSVRVLYVCGNHAGDILPLFSDGTPENFHVFPSHGWDSVRLDGHTVASGTSDLATPGIFDRIPEATSEDGLPVYHIVVLHGEISNAAHEAADTIPLPLLKKRGITYLALGHEHAYKSKALERGALWAYAGCPEGRGFDECGERGYLLVDTDRAPEESVTFVPFAVRTLHHLTVSVEGEATFLGMETRLAEAVAKIPEGDMVKVTLTGALDPDVPVDLSHLAKNLTDRFFCARLENKTKLAVRPEDYEHDVSLKGEFIRVVLASRMSDEEKERTILCGLRALRGEEVDG